MSDKLEDKTALAVAEKLQEILPLFVSQVLELAEQEDLPAAAVMMKAVAGAFMPIIGAVPPEHRDECLAELLALFAGELFDLYRMTIHSPHLFAGWTLEEQDKEED